MTTRDTPRVEPAGDAGGIADAAAQLDMAGEAVDDRLDRFAVDGFAREGAVEIDDVEIFGPGVGEDHRLCGGVVAVHRRAVHIALGEADDLPGLQVDGGEDD